MYVSHAYLLQFFPLQRMPVCVSWAHARGSRSTCGRSELPCIADTDQWSTDAPCTGPGTNVTATLDPGCPMMKQSSCYEMGPGQVCNPVTQAQQNYVIEVPLVDGSSAFVWTGDKWQQSPDGLYDEQPQTWLPLTFDGDTILPLTYVDTFTLDVAV